MIKTLEKRKEYRNSSIDSTKRSTEASQGALVVKNLPANTGDIRNAGLIPGSGRSLEKEMATHPSILVWRIPWTGEPGRP